MQNAREIKKRIKTVDNISHLTDAMQKIAASRLSKYKMRLSGSIPFSDTIKNELTRLVASQENYSHALSEKHAIGKTLIAVITSDKGLCGGYNDNLTRAVSEFIDKTGKENTSLMIFGRKGYRYFHSRRYPIIERWLDNPVFFEYSFSEEIARILTGRFTGLEFSEVYFAYTSFISMARNRPVIKKLLPVDLEITAQAIKTPDLHLYEPSLKKITDYMMEQYVNSQVWRYMLESYTSEYASRTVAMELATKNSLEMIDELTLLANKLRQASITTELTDILGSI